MTFSIVGFDPATGDLGVAVASKFPAVGAVVPWIEAGVGAVATQSFVNARYGPDGLDLLRRGEEPVTATQILTTADDQRDMRQLGIVDGGGRAASYTGPDCLDWAGGSVGDGVAIQGNILVGAGVVTAMEQAWSAAAGAPLSERLMAALLAGDHAGGDRRGRQSASLHVKRAGAGYGGATDQLVDLRVDDHADPVPELQRLLAINELLFGATPEERWRSIGLDVALQIRRALPRWGLDVAADGALDQSLEATLRTWVITENLDERWYSGDRIDPVVLEHLLRRD